MSKHSPLCRRHLLARLAAERAGLLWQCIGLDEKSLTQVPACGDWTIREVLVHIAAWDRWVLRQLSRVLAGEAPDLTARDMDAFNAANVAAWRGRSLEELATELHEARAAWVTWMESLPVEAFFQRRPIGKGDWSPPTWARIFQEHDAEHAAQIVAWQEAGELKAKTGPKAVLLAALAAAREELLAAAALVPPEERITRPVCGEWTLKDVLGHVADWEKFCVDGLRQMAAGHPPQVERVEDVDAWNRAHAEARREQPWETVWADFRAARQALLEVLEGMDQASLEHTLPGVWDPETTPYAWALACLDHDREHAQGLRSNLTSGGNR